MGRACLLLLAVILAACRFDPSGLRPEDSGPAQDAPAQDGPARDGPVQDAPAQDGPAQDGPAQDGPAQDASVQDASVQDGLVPDALANDAAAADQSAVDPLAPFGAPQPVIELNSSGSEDDPSLTADMLEIYFERDGDIWRSTRASLAAPWSPPQAVVELNSAEVDATPGVSPDGLTLFFDSTRQHAAALGGTDIYMSNRSLRGDLWSTPAPVVELNTQYDDLCAWSSPDLLAIVFDSSRPGGPGDRDLYSASRVSISLAWSTPQIIDGISSSGKDECPWMNPAFTVLYFASDRGGGAGGHDIWVTIRSSTTVSFDPPVAVQGVNSTSADGDPWISPDMRTLYFSSDRNGNPDLFMATR